MSNPKRIFVTGASGFIGRHTLKLFGDPDKWRIAVLLREGSDIPDANDNLEIVRGDVNSPKTYRKALTGADVVLHMAARTGAASASEHDRVGRIATENLISEAERAGVKRFLFVSSIAAGYPDLAFYPYGKAKRDAESSLVRSGIQFCIIRPTLVLGRDSPIWKTLNLLAGLPVIPLPKRKQSAKVQPVSATDVAMGIYEILDNDRFDNETLDIGGPDIVEFGEFLGMIAEAQKGKKPHLIPFPVRLIQYPLAAIEPFARPVLPATAGQFAVFANDGVIQGNWLTDSLHQTSEPLENLVRDLSASTNSDQEDGEVTDPEQLLRDARAFSRYLVGRELSADASEHYCAACIAHGLDREPRVGAANCAIILSRKGYWGLWLADGYAALFDRAGLLRRRLIVITAVLENAPETHELYDRSIRGGALAALASLAVSAVAAGLQLFVGTITVLVMRPVFAATRGKKGKAV